VGEAKRKEEEEEKRRNAFVKTKRAGCWRWLSYSNMNTMAFWYHSCPILLCAMVAVILICLIACYLHYIVLLPLFISVLFIYFIYLILYHCRVYLGTLYWALRFYYYCCCSFTLFSRVVLLMPLRLDRWYLTVGWAVGSCSRLRRCLGVKQHAIYLAVLCCHELSPAVYSGSVW